MQLPEQAATSTPVHRAFCHVRTQKLDAVFLLQAPDKGRIIKWPATDILVDHVALLDERHVSVHHFLHQSLEENLGLPVEQRGGLGGVAQKLFNFGRAEVLRVHLSARG